MSRTTTIIGTLACTLIVTLLGWLHYRVHDFAGEFGRDLAIVQTDVKALQRSEAQHGVKLDLLIEQVRGQGGRH